MKYVFLGFVIAIMITFTLNFSARAANTLTLVDEYRDGDQKVCIYSDGRHTATVYKDGAGGCPTKYIKR